LFPEKFCQARSLVFVALQESSNMRFTPKWSTKWLAAFAAVFVLTFLAVPPRSLAQDQPGDDQDDPPTRAARLSYTGGAVSFAPAGSDEWVDAVVNRPLTTGDKLWTDQGGRVELRVDAYAIRLGELTGFSFLNLDDRTVQIRLTEGTVNVRVRRLDQDQTLEIDTPNIAFNVLRPGSYRVSVNENGDSTIVNVRDGQGEVTGGDSAYPIRAGQSATFAGTDQLSADVEGYPGDDAFDRWCYDRDSRWDRSQSARYVSDDVVGYEDLDDYGGWRTVNEYGTVWFPHTTIVGWQPYRYGHWVWISPWGWTWVDDAPWGFAPFHYGRWVTVNGVWGWVPVAPRPAVVTVAYVRPVYAPALVAWVGGPRFSVSVGVGGGGVAWFPLGPRDVYCPAYRVTPRYVERVNVYNTTIINRTQVTNVYNTVYVQKNVTNVNYQNRTYVTATSQASFTSAQPVGRNLVRVDSREAASAQVSPMTPAVAPQQRSVMGGAASARVRPPAQAISRQVVAKTAPPPPAASVNQQLQKVQANGGRPVAVSQIRENNQPRNNVRVVQEARQTQLPPQGQRVTTRPNQANQPAQAQPNSNRPGQQNQPPVQQNNNRPAQQNQPAQVQPNNRPPQQNVPAQALPNNPPQPNNSNRPGNQPNQPQAQPDNRPNNNNRNFNDRPPSSRPPVNPQVQERQQQQIDNLRKQQDQERQKLEQKQVQQNQKLEQQNANQQRQQQQQQRQQQQLEQMERKHDQQQQKEQQRQQQEVAKQQQRQQQQQQSRPPKQDKPPKEDKDRPH
jgi:hypothetical protein